MTNRFLYAAVLAAGSGVRMQSSRPKPLHRLVGKPMVMHVLESLVSVDLKWVGLVVGHQSERVIKELIDSGLPDLPLHFIQQPMQNGTGDAASVVLASLPEESNNETEESDILILPGDIPLLDASVVALLVDHHQKTQAAATLLTVELDDPSGYGRIVRDHRGSVQSVVEHNDATESQLAINEVNTSVYCFKTGLLGPALRRITDANSKGEYYLTDVVAVLTEAGHKVETVALTDASLAIGVNDRSQLASAEAELRSRLNEKWMQSGVTMINPAATYVDATVRLSKDVCLHPGTRLQGTTIVESGAEIGPNTWLIDCSVGEGATVNQTQARQVTIGARAQVGPFVLLQPGYEVAPGGRIGPFFSSPIESEG